MTAIAYCRIPVKDPLRLRIGLWTLETSDKEKRGEAKRGKIKRTAVRELADDRRSGNLCLHIGF